MLVFIILYSFSCRVSSHGGSRCALSASLLAVEQLESELSSYLSWKTTDSILHAMQLPTENAYLENEPEQDTLSWYRWKVAHFMKVSTICDV